MIPLLEMNGWLLGLTAVYQRGGNLLDGVSLLGGVRLLDGVGDESI